MKKFKKIFAVILSLAMVMGMSLTTFAAQKESGVASEGDTEQVKIENISGDATVTLYQIASGVYGDSGKGLIKYKYVKGIDPMSKQPTSGEINAAYQAILGGTTEATSVDVQTNVTGTYTSKELPVGAYIAIISGATDGSIYNPVLLTVSYNETGALEAGDVNVNNGYTYGSTAVAKKTTPDVDKEIVEGTTPDGDRKTASVGDVITYQIAPTMPSYPENATNKTFFFADTMSKGLTFVYDSLNITFADSEQKIIATKNEDGSITFTTDREGETIVVATATEGNNGFYLNFDYDSLLYGTVVDDDPIDSMGLAIYVHTPLITYQAVLNDDAVVGDPGNPNDARMYYSNEPNNGSTFEPTEDNPEPTEGETPGVKKEEDKEIVYTYQLAFLKTGEGDDADKLANAVFGIYTDADCTNEIDVVKTNENGYAVSSKVAAGTYYVKELVAPTGYHLNDKVYSITANQTSATTTITTTKREWKYTTNPEGTDGVQIGWIDTKNGNVFYSLKSANTDRLPDDVDSMGVIQYPIDTTGFMPAYVVYDNTVVETSSEITTNGNGTASTIIDLAADDDNKVIGSIPNTSLASLPSTGGIGTTIFTVGGCIIMVVAAALFFASRRKSTKSAK